MRVVLYLLIAAVLLSTNPVYAASADNARDSTMRIALSFDDAPKGDGPRFSGDERAAVLIDALAKLVPKTLLTRQGHFAALAVDAGLDPRMLTHLAIEESQIDALLAERKVFGGYDND